MRLLALLLLVPLPAAAQPSWEAELRVGYGVALSGGNGMPGVHGAPLTIAAIATVPTNVEPPLAAFGGLVIEALDRTAAGATAGMRLSPGETFRFSLGGTWIASPYTLWGANVSGGACKRLGTGVSVCADVQLTTYIAGTDLPDHRAVTQIQLVGGVRFDAP